MFFIAHGNRRVWFAGSTANPNGAWVTQQARNLGFDLSDQGVRILIRDRDSKYSGPFDQVSHSEGIRTVKTPVRAPKANAMAERFVRTVRVECLDWLPILNRRHLERVLRIYVTTTTARGRIVPSGSDHPNATSDLSDHLSARSGAATDSAASSTSTTEQPLDARHE